MPVLARASGLRQQLRPTLCLWAEYSTGSIDIDADKTKIIPVPAKSLAAAKKVKMELFQKRNFYTCN